MLHPLSVLRALKGNGVRQLRKLSGLKARPKAPVLGQALDAIVARHAGQCRQLRQWLPEEMDLTGIQACEAGPGDNLANAALLLGLGASHVDLVELQPPVISAKQVQVLTALRDQGIPMDVGAIGLASSPDLDPKKISYHKMFMDDFVADCRYDLIYSFCVGEHVENLEAFFTSCHRATKPGGLNIHMIDLGGHGEFEDPVPPLDFQTYPDWLFAMMYPAYHRATRRLLGQYLSVLEKIGFRVEKVHRLREVDPDYLEKIHPRLRAEARAASQEELSVIEFAVSVRKPE